MSVLLAAGLHAGEHPSRTIDASDKAG